MEHLAGRVVSGKHQWVAIQRQRNPRPFGADLVLPSLLEGEEDHLYSYVPIGKRLFDIGFSLLLLIPLSVVMMVVTIVLLILQGRPVLFVQWRMCTPSRAFPLIKFRTMITADTEFGVTGAEQHWRITKVGHFLRRSRLDELPQLLNILRGHMSFVGPRPPTPELVRACPEVFAQVLRNRPGVTGLATLVYHRHEYNILHKSGSAETTRCIYLRRCLPTKARIDMIYQKNRSLWLDLWIIWSTVRVIVFSAGGPVRRKRRATSRREKAGRNR